MLIYSQWRPDGTYDYFRTSVVAPLGDDLPVPDLDPVGDLGVPSTEAGRPIPPGAIYDGSGELAQGVIAPMDTSRIGAVAWSTLPAYTWFLLGAATMGAIWWLVGVRSR